MLLDALGETVIDRKRRRQIRRAVINCQLVEICPIDVKLREIALEKIFVARIERINVAVKKIFR